MQPPLTFHCCCFRIQDFQTPHSFLDRWILISETVAPKKRFQSLPAEPQISIFCTLTSIWAAILYRIVPSEFFSRILRVSPRGQAARARRSPEFPIDFYESTDGISAASIRLFLSSSVVSPRLGKSTAVTF